MPNFKRITEAREKARRIREYAVAFRRELQIQRVAEIHPKADNNNDVRLFVVKLPEIKSGRAA